MSYHDKSYKISLTKDQLVSALFGQSVCTIDDGDEGKFVVYYFSGWDYTPAELPEEKHTVTFDIYGKLEDSNRYGITGKVVLEADDVEEGYSGRVDVRFEDGWD